MQTAQLELHNCYTDTEQVTIVIDDPDILENKHYFTQHYQDCTYDKGVSAVVVQLDYPEYVDTVVCYHCGLTIPKESAIKAEWYDTPFDNEPETLHFCSILCADCEEGRVYSKDFAYFTCEECGRTICEQNPNNGWLVQYRMINDYEQICTSCYEKICFEEGIDRESFENNQLKGLFFDDSELIENGFTEEENFRSYYVYGESDAERYCKRAIELIDAGHIVINSYERMGIGGLEGYVTMWYKAVK